MSLIGVKTEARASSAKPPTSSLAPSQLTSAILLNAAELLESRVQNPNPDRIDQLAESLRDKVPPAPQGGPSSSGGPKHSEDSSSERHASHGGNGVHAPTPQQQPQEQDRSQQQQPQQQERQQQERQQSSGGGGPSLPPRGAMPTLPARAGTKPAAAPGGGGPSLPSRPSGNLLWGFFVIWGGENIPAFSTQLSRIACSLASGSISTRQTDGIISIMLCTGSR